VRLDPSVTLVGSPPIVGPGTVLVAPIPSLDVAHTTATLTVTAVGQPGDVLVTFAGLVSPPYATPWGEAWVLPTDPILDGTLLPAAAATTFSRTFASVPPFVVLTLQSIAIAPASTLRIGVPTRFAWNRSPRPARFAWI
jgi:hypothetical protein